MPNMTILAAILPKIFGKKVILDIHDTVPETFVSKFDSKTHPLVKILYLEEKISCVLASKIICVNHPQRDLLVDRGIPRKKIFISMNVPNDLRFKREKTERELLRKNDCFRIVYHGTVTERLGIDLAIHAASRLQHLIPNFEFHLWGAGNYLNTCQALAQELNLTDRVYFHGRIPHHDIPKVLKAMDLGIIPNRKFIATELMLPVKMLEYVALNIPVVVPRLGTIQYYFSDDMVGFFDPDNLDSMVQIIWTLYKNTNRRQKQAEKANEFLEKYGWHKQKISFLQFYENLVSNGFE
jgi:glycosyltransferase involved in cell wall biosynthesis